MEEWLNTIESKLSIVMNRGILIVEGFTGVVGGSLFFGVFDAADNMAIEAKLYYHAKVGSFRDSIRVLRDSIGGSVSVWSFACFKRRLPVGDITRSFRYSREQALLAGQ